MRSWSACLDPAGAPLGSQRLYDEVLEVVLGPGAAARCQLAPGDCFAPPPPPPPPRALHVIWFTV